jgi:hypothetical protein
LRKTLEGRIGAESLDFVGVHLEIASQAVFEAIVLLPPIQSLVEPVL